MDKANLVVTFQLAGETGMQVKTVSRIEVDGRGALRLHDSEDGVTEQLCLRELRSLQVRTMPAVEASLAVA